MPYVEVGGRRVVLLTELAAARLAGAAETSAAEARKSGVRNPDLEDAANSCREALESLRNREISGAAVPRTGTAVGTAPAGPPTMGPVMSVAAIARKWDCRREYVRRLCRMGKFPGAVHTRNGWEIPAGAVKKFEETR